MRPSVPAESPGRDQVLSELDEFVAGGRVIFSRRQRCSSTDRKGNSFRLHVRNRSTRMAIANITEGQMQELRVFSS